MIKIDQMMLRIAAIGLLFFVLQTFAEEAQDKQANPPSEVKERLLDLQSSLSELRILKSRLQKDLTKKVNLDDAAELNIQLETLNKEISNLRKTFEYLAIGGVDLDSIEKEPQEFNLEKELIQVTQPLLDMLKSLTEKPRKIEQLNNVIEQNQAKKAIIEKALTSLESNFSIESPKNVRTALEDIKERWQQRLSENQRESELAEFHLNTLQGANISWYETIRDEARAFFEGRGLTLVIAIFASVMVWMFTRLLLWLVKQCQRGKSCNKRPKVHYRLASYAFTLLTTFFIITSVIVVFYVRGDMLLLALSLVALAVTVLGMRNFLPQYIAEAKLMINVGAVREGERMIYDGLPWEVRTINIYSILHNPELDGIKRLPLAALRDMTSRPCRSESWFPTSKGDFILLSDGLLAEVLRQTPEMVYLKAKGGMHRNLPSRDFIGMGVLNLSRGESFSVITVFGIDYEHQDIALSQVPKAFHAALQGALKDSGLGEHLKDVMVELKSAGASSLDYHIQINVKSSAAPLYLKLERLLQRTCIQVCSQYGWGIPFPQITVHQAPSVNDSSALTRPVLS